MNLTPEDGGGNAAFYVVDIGNNTSDATHNSQTNAFTAKTEQLGSGDVVGSLIISQQSGSTDAGHPLGHVAYGQFIQAAARANPSQAIGLEIDLTNNSGNDWTTTNGTFGSSIHTAANGTNRVMSAFWVSAGSGAATFDSIMRIDSGTATTWIFDVLGSATNLLQTGSGTTYTNGIDLSNSTISGSAFKSSNFNVSGAGVISTTNSTGSSSTSTGALTVTGGVGIGGAINVGGAGNVTGNLTTNGVLATAPTSGTATAQITAPSSQKSVLSFIQSATTEWQFAMQTSGTELIVSDVPNSISALDINGGSTKTVTIGYSGASASPSTGALVVTGGIGVGGQSFFGSTVVINPASSAAIIDFFSPSGQQAGFSINSGATTEWQFLMQTSGTELLFYDAPNGVAAVDIFGTTTKKVVIGYTTATSSSSTGSLVVSGGVGVAGDIFTAGAVRSNAGFNANGSAGITQTCTVNQAKTLIFTLGILTGGSCNT